MQHFFHQQYGYLEGEPPIILDNQVTYSRFVRMFVHANISRSVLFPVSKVVAGHTFLCFDIGFWQTHTLEKPHPSASACRCQFDGIRSDHPGPPISCQFGSGQWRLCSSSAGSTDCVADWLKVFNIDQHEVLSEVRRLDLADGVPTNHGFGGKT